MKEVPLEEIRRITGSPAHDKKLPYGYSGFAVNLGHKRIVRVETAPYIDLEDNTNAVLGVFVKNNKGSHDVYKIPYYDDGGFAVSKPKLREDILVGGLRLQPASMVVNPKLTERLQKGKKCILFPKATVHREVDLQQNYLRLGTEEEPTEAEKIKLRALVSHLKTQEFCEGLHLRGATIVMKGKAKAPRKTGK